MIECKSLWVRKTFFESNRYFFFDSLFIIFLLFSWLGSSTQKILARSGADEAGIHRNFLSSWARFWEAMRAVFPPIQRVCCRKDRLGKKRKHRSQRHDSQVALFGSIEREDMLGFGWRLIAILIVITFSLKVTLFGIDSCFDRRYGTTFFFSFFLVFNEVNSSVSVVQHAGYKRGHWNLTPSFLDSFEKPSLQLLNWLWLVGPSHNRVKGQELNQGIEIGGGDKVG